MRMTETAIVSKEDNYRLMEAKRAQQLRESEKKVAARDLELKESAKRCESLEKKIKELQATRDDFSHKLVTVHQSLWETKQKLYASQEAQRKMSKDGTKLPE